MSAFQSKSILVLGGSRGIGAAIVRRFAAEGAAVTFTYAGSPEDARRLAGETGSTALLTDSADRDAVIETVRKSGPLDVLVVNAGIAIFGDALDQDPDAVDRLFRINIHAPYHAAVEAARRMPEGGRIIVIGSVNGDRMPVPGMASYAMSKSARQGLARGLARDFGPRGKPPRLSTKSSYFASAWSSISGHPCSWHVSRTNSRVSSMPMPVLI